MKFIAGLLMGALATLLVASLSTFRWEPPSRLAAVTVASLEPNPDIELALSPAEPIRSVTVDPLPRPAPVAEQRPPAGFETVRTVGEVPEPAVEKLASVELVQGVVTEDVANVETAVVWKPFHSEVSANGFARRLSTQLGYPFRALREGPARYHVVFDYDTDQQRELLQQQVTALTGFEAI